MEARALERWESELLDALGGRDQVSPQQATMCRMASCTRLLLELVDAYLLKLGSPVNQGKRALFPIILQRQALAAALQSQLQAIGLERRTKPAMTLQQYLLQRDRALISTAPAPSDAATGAIEGDP
jgi:hypothetical protein